MHAAMYIVRYLSGTPDLSLRFGPKTNHNGELVGYTDASYAGCEDTSRSTSGYVFMFWNDPVSHSSKRQDTVATSTTEAEYIDQCNAGKEVYFLAAVLGALKYLIENLIDLRADNQAVIALVHNPVSHQRTKHIAVRYHKIRELMAEEVIKLIYISIKDMVVDGLTKFFTSALFRRFVDMLELANEETN